MTPTATAFAILTQLMVMHGATPLDAPHRATDAVLQVRLRPVTAKGVALKDAPWTDVAYCAPKDCAGAMWQQSNARKITDAIAVLVPLALRRKT